MIERLQELSEELKRLKERYQEIRGYF